MAKLPVSEKMSDAHDRSSWIRKMFDEGVELKARIGAENVFDFTLGNPVDEPPARVIDTLRKLVTDNTPGSHRYMSNAGFADVRKQVADHRSKESGLLFDASNIIMTCGAGGALNVIIKALIDPGDEVVIVAPYFAEYLFYIDNHQGKPVIAQTDEKFRISAAEIERTISEKTRIVILNSPNNPTGAVYRKQALDEVGALLEKKSAEYGGPIYLVMDEPYKKLLYDGVEAPDIFQSYDKVIVATSHSKDLNLPGERIGYIAVGPQNDEVETIVKTMVMANRILGFVNAPALFQRLAGQLQDVKVDMTTYTKNRDVLLSGLTAAGYKVVPPDGGFYLFPKAPGGDEFAFIDSLKKLNILVAPGTGFGWPGHFRISFCCDTITCQKAIPGFTEAFA